MKDIKQIELELDEDIPRDVVSLRDGGGGRKLSYLEGWYVIDRLNKIFGPLNWAKEIMDIRLVDAPKPTYIAKIRLSVIKPDHTVVIKEAYGYGSDKHSGSPHELAIKEAVTDALKVAAKDFGMSLGLALYDKTQERVSDDVQTITGRITSEPNSQTLPKDGKLNVKTGQSQVIIASSASGYDVETVRAILPTQAKPTHTKDGLSEAIKSYFKVVEAQKRLTKDVFRSEYLSEFSASKVDDLNVEQMETVLKRLKTLAESK